jgi:hypothetical protein
MQSPVVSRRSQFCAIPDVQSRARQQAGALLPDELLPLLAVGALNAAALCEDGFFYSKQGLREQENLLLQGRKSEGQIC